jgi:hypothetical protein
MLARCLPSILSSSHINIMNLAPLCSPGLKLPASPRKDAERSIRFMQDQHTEVLRMLYNEIETLKAQNKGRSFCLCFSW